MKSHEMCKEKKKDELINSTGGQCSIDPNLRNVLVYISHMSSMFTYVNSSTVRNYGALVVNALTIPVLPDFTMSVDH